MAIVSSTRASVFDLSVNLIVGSDDNFEGVIIDSAFLLAGASASDLVNKTIYREFLNAEFDTENDALTRFAELGGTLQVVCTAASNAIDPNSALTIADGKPAVLTSVFGSPEDIGKAAVKIALQHSISG